MHRYFLLNLSKRVASLELILRRDPRLVDLLKRFESKETGDTTFLERVHNLIGNTT